RLDDDSAYHLPYTRAFLDTGGLPFLADLRFPTLPQLQELAWGPLLAWGGEGGVTAMVLAETLLVAVLVAGIAARHAGPAAGAAAAGLWLGHPYVVLYGTAAFVDTALALFVVGAFAAIDLAREERRRDTGEVDGLPGETRREGQREGTADEVRGGSGTHWLAVAGLLAGTAAGIKYHGLVFLLLALSYALLAVGPWRPRRRRRPPGTMDRGTRTMQAGTLPSVALLALVALLAAGPTYIHLARLTGNPVFPLLPQVFGYSPWAIEDIERAVDRTPEGDPPGTAPAPRPRLTQLDRAADPSRGRLAGAVVGLLELPARLTLRPGPEWGPPPFHPALLLAAPLVLLPGVRRRGLLLAAAAVVPYGLLWFSTGRDPRYLFPAVALLSPLLGAGLARPLTLPGDGAWARSPLALAALLLVLAAPGAAYATHRLAVQGPPPTTPAARDAYLARRLPGYRPLRHLGAAGTTGRGCTVYALRGGQLQYDSPCRLLGSDLGPGRYARFLPLLGAPDRLRRELAALGATHLLLVEPYATPRHVEPLVAEGSFRLLHRDPRAALFALGTPDP
ncbi:MAG TPA: hypothetical protein VHQ65_05010, partial [Thermoanaerobaculia bacterium]|nr:hypothetical protein [Thermoanaerobaculia bacterium]